MVGFNECLKLILSSRDERLGERHTCGLGKVCSVSNQPAHGAVGCLVEPGLYTLGVELVLAGQKGQLVILLKLLQTDGTLLVKIIPQEAGRK